ncbi:MAG: Ig-like domain-containing protein [Lepagella sp.]
MKKFLLSLTLILGCIPFFAQAEETTRELYKAQFGPDYNSKGVSAYNADWTITCGETTWDVSCFNNNNNGWEYVRAGSKSLTNGTVATLTNQTAFPEKITSVVISARRTNAGAADYASSATLTVSATTLSEPLSFDITEQVNALTTAADATTITVDIDSPVENATYELKLELPKSSNNGWFELHSVSYVGVPAAGELLDANLAFPQDSYSVVFGDEFTSPVATTDSDAAISYASDNADVAEVDATSGVVTIKGIGVATISAAVEANDTYKADNASYTLTVTDPNILFSWEMGPDGVFTYEKVATSDVNAWSYNSKYGLVGSGFVSSTTNVCDEVAVSPVIELPATGGVTLDFMNAFNNYKVNNTMIEVADFPGNYAFLVVREEGATEWTRIGEPTAPTAFNWTFYANDPVSLTAYKGKKVQFGFEYVSTEECAGTWEVKNIVVKKFDVDPIDSEISFPETEYSATIGEIFESPVASTISDGTVAYSSSDETVATVDAATGEVTLVAQGTTVITATVEATDTYLAGSASYTLIVTDPNAPEVLFSWTVGGEEVFSFEQVAASENYAWKYSSQYGLVGSGYISGAAVALDEVAASPVIDLTQKKEVTLDFKTVFNQYKVNGSNIDVTTFPGKYAFLVVREEGETEWTRFAEPTAPAAFNWTFYDNETVSLEEYKGKKIQFGFEYVSTDECAGTWELKDIVVKGKTESGVANIELDETAAPVYYNLQGVRVANPEKGLYIVVKGNKSSKVIF